MDGNNTLSLFGKLIQDLLFYYSEAIVGQHPHRSSFSLITIYIEPLIQLRVEVLLNINQTFFCLYNKIFDKISISS